MHRSGSLEFSSVKVEDSGVYECHAENEAGVADRRITLEVQGGYCFRFVTSNGDTVTCDSKRQALLEIRRLWNLKVSKESHYYIGRVTLRPN